MTKSGDIEDLNKIVNSNIVSDFFKYINIRKIDGDEPKRKSNLKKLSKQERDVLADLNVLYEEKKYEELLLQIDEKYKEDRSGSQYSCRLMELKAKTISLFFADKKEELKSTYLELIKLDSKQEGYYLDAFYAMEDYDSKIFFIDKAINVFPADFYLYNKKVSYLLEYAQDIRYESNYSNLLNDINSCISKSIELHPSPENDALIMMISFIKLKESDPTRLKEKVKEAINNYFNKNTVLYAQIVSKDYSLLSIDENNAMQILKNICSTYNKADSPQKYEKCLLALLSFCEKTGKKDEYRKLVEEYKNDFFPSITFEHIIIKDRISFFGEIEEVEQEVLEKMDKLNDINEKNFYQDLLFKLYYFTNNKDKIKEAFNSLNNPSLEDKINYYETIEDYDSIIQLLNEHWQANPKTLPQICTYSYCLLQKKDYQKSYNFISNYYANPEYADGVIYINYFMSEMNYRNKKVNDMRSKIQEKILNNKDQFSKEVLIAAHALLNEKNEMIKCIRQLKKSDSLLKYRLVKWPVLRKFVNDTDFRSTLDLD